ncbi:MAG: DUF1189 family protein [bacterium]|nr:DUF1189 family protein [bacterium]
MNKLKTWWFVFCNSLLSPSYYKSILSSKFSFSLKYLVVLMFFVYLTTAAKVGLVGYRLLPQVPLFANKLTSTLQTAYPQELVVTIKNGQLSTNVKEPYVWDWPYQFDEKEKKPDMHFLTIDTHASLDDYPTYTTYILVTKNNIIYPSSSNEGRSGEYRVYSLSQIKDSVTFDRTTYDAVLQKLSPFIQKLPTIVAIFIVAGIFFVMIFGTLFGLIWNMIYLLFMTVVILIIAKIMNKNLSYSQLYQFGMYGLTLPILVSVLVSLSGLHIPFIFTLVFIIWMSVVVNKLQVVTKNNLV